MKRSLMAIALSSLLPLVYFGNVILPPSAQATHKCEKWIDLNPFIEGSTCVRGAFRGHSPINYLIDKIYDLIPEWEKLGLPCPDGYTCGYEEMIETLGLDPRKVFKLAGRAAIFYFLPQSVSSGATLVDFLYKTGATGDKKIIEILKSCNWLLSQKNEDIVVEAIQENMTTFGQLLYYGGINHACNNPHLWIK